MACCSSECVLTFLYAGDNFYSTISETFRNRAHVHVCTLFCLEWLILRLSRILIFLPGTFCIKERNSITTVLLQNHHHHAYWSSLTARSKSEMVLHHCMVSHFYISVFTSKTVLTNLLTSLPSRRWNYSFHINILFRMSNIASIKHIFYLVLLFSAFHKLILLNVFSPSFFLS
jgi:hypothetical protein